MTAHGARRLGKSGALLILVFDAPVSCQKPTQSLAFEVVSIKSAPRPSFSSANPGMVDDAQARFTSIQMAYLLELAFAIPPSRIYAPAWISDAYYEISAKLPAGATQARLPEMLQSMLRTRFHLKEHHEERILPVYHLLIGKGPLRIQPSTSDPSEHGGCDARPGFWVCTNVTIGQVVKLLGLGFNFRAPVAFDSWWLDRPLIDKTGLDGRYDFKMDIGPAGGRGAAKEGTTPISTVADALKGLGFLLQPGKAVFDFVVIDSLERVPTEN